MGQRVIGIDPGAKRLRLVGGGMVAYDHLILAVGARNRILPVKGAELALYLRTLDEAAALKERLSEEGRVWS